MTIKPPVMFTQVVYSGLGSNLLPLIALDSGHLQGAHRLPTPD